MSELNQLKDEEKRILSRLVDIAYYGTGDDDLEDLLVRSLMRVRLLIVNLEASQSQCVKKSIWLM